MPASMLGFLVIRPADCGDQTGDAYSNKGRTYVVKARSIVERSRDTKHLFIAYDGSMHDWAMLLICVLNIRSLSIVIPKSLTTADACITESLRV